MYRRFKGTLVWHFEQRCSSWPGLNYDESEMPAVGRLCPDCLKLEQEVLNRRIEDSRETDEKKQD